MKNILIILTLFAFAQSGCQQNSSTNSHNNGGTEIVLNKGETWVVVPEMMGIIQTMESDVNAFDGTNLEEHKVLATKLQDNINKLTSNCTMKGQGHDELHKWLLPFLDTVEAYNKATSAQEAQNTYNTIQASFSSVNNYFK
jgi:hypothetical protein